jgi:hypothetical protein
MIRAAIDEHPAFDRTTRSIYAKGSYANNTNVRLDSDVDIVVQCDDLFYYNYADNYQPPPSPIRPYTGAWTPSTWRAEVVAALENYFGTSEVETTGAIAIAIKEKVGSRPNADVVPSIDYRMYWSADRTNVQEGSVVYPADGSVRIVNWPQQQLVNGRAKNDRTGRRYKSFARALKNGENTLLMAGVIAEKPSYLMECLVYNVADTTLQHGTLEQGFNASLTELWAGLESEAHKKWMEPNELKYLFDSTKKWTVQDARDVVLYTWLHLYK